MPYCSSIVQHERLLILDYGSQYTQLIARRARELGVFAEVRRFDVPSSELRFLEPKAIVLSGGPASASEARAPTLNPTVFPLSVPVLGICYGMQLVAKELGGKLRSGTSREYGDAELVLEQEGKLLAGLPRRSRVWASHGDSVEKLPTGFVRTATTADGVVAAAEDANRRVFLVQFHPEVVHTEFGERILRNFLFDISRFRGDWEVESIVDELTERIRTQVGAREVLCAVSGGVDSSVVAALLHRAVPGHVHAVFVDHGLLRAGEAAEVEAALRPLLGSDLTTINARARFLTTLKGVTDPEEKRKRIGRTFIEVFEAEAKHAGRIDLLAQGTLYPDVIESAGTGGPSATIKSHHNVGGLPERMRLELVEPVRGLFKDEVRAVGRALGLPEALVGRHPFPGPGLAVRILGAVTPESLATLAKADQIFIEELRTSKLYNDVWQAFAVLLPVRTVGVMGDGRTYQQVIALRAVTSSDGMTAEWAHLPHDFLAHVSSRIVNEVPGVNRVVYDISSKPPATIEWE
jgi:GMP synthase (glutamine-hydrolysing)